MDKTEHLNRIDDEIIARIRKSKFIVSDFTQQKQGVYFEAGFALGLGLQVVWMCEKEDLKNTHFDTRQYNTIEWTKENFVEAKNRLRNRIEANFGRGLTATPQ